MFDKFSAGDQQVDVNMVQGDLDDLQCRTKEIRTFVDKRVAHWDKRHFTQIPTFIQLNSCLDLLGALVKKYLNVLRAESHELLPVWQYDWMSVFTKPWIRAVAHRSK